MLLLDAEIASNLKEHFQIKAFFDVNVYFVNGLWVPFNNVLQVHAAFDAVCNNGFLHSLIIVNRKEDFLFCL